MRSETGSSLLEDLSQRRPSVASRLAVELRERGIRHCHWKGTHSIQHALNGSKDLDLLVHVDDSTAFQRVMSDCGFKEVAPEISSRLPSTTSFYGYEGSTHRLLNLHVHFRCVVGNPLRGVYFLPIETAVLESTLETSCFPSILPEFELIVFVLRMLLDTRAWSAAPSSGVCLSDARQQEFEYLQTQVSKTHLDPILCNHFSFIDASLFHECRKALVEPIPKRLRARLTQQLRHSMMSHHLSSTGTSPLAGIWHRALRAVRIRCLGRSPRKQRFISGGTMVAIVGGDGAGKTTTIGHIRKWLSRHFDIRTVHLGKPPRSWTTKLIRGTLKAARGLDHLVKHKSSGSVSLENWSKMGWFFCIARDRYLSYTSARRHVAAGEIVVFDRWPVPSVMSMDGPQIRRLAGDGKMNGLLTWMANCEERWHEKIGQPDCMVVLKLDPQIAVRRKPEEDAQFVATRGMEVWNAPWHQTDALVVDASAPLESVLSEVKNHVWTSF